MKPIYIVFVLLFSASFALAQNSSVGRTSFAILGGVNLQNLTGTDYTNNKLENDMIIGYHAGVNVQIPLVPEFYFQPGLLFSTKGAKSPGELINTTFKLSYVEMPLNLVYKGALGNGFVMVGFGPYVGYGVKGKTIYEGGGSGSYESDIKFQNVVELTDPFTTPYFRALDAGGNVFAGYEMSNGVFVQLNTQFGMLAINPEDKRFPEGETAIRNTGFGLSIGYRIRP